MEAIALLVGIIVGLVAGAGMFYLAAFAALRDTRDRWISRLETHRAELIALIMAAELRGWGTATTTLNRQIIRINEDLKKASKL